MMNYYKSEFTRSALDRVVAYSEMASLRRKWDFLRMNRVLKQFDIAGTCALVTGGGSGLGRSMALALRDAGAQVAVVGRSERILDVHSDGLVPIRRDLASPRAAEEAVADCKKSLGGLDILITAHAIVSRSKAEEFDVETWHTTVEINLVS